MMYHVPVNHTTHEMTSSPIPMPQTKSRIRPVSLPRDLPQLQRLLRDVFSSNFEMDGSQPLAHTDQQLGWLLRLANLGQAIHSGYVWELDGKLAGNISLIPTKTDGRVIIANVAIAPDQRRQGMARQLLNTALHHLVDRRIKTVTLQVDVDNGGAKQLYESFGFRPVGSTIYWQAKPGEWSELAAYTPHTSSPNHKNHARPSRSWHRASDELDIRPLPPSDWQTAYALDIQSNPLDLNWPNIIQPDTYRSKFFQQIDDFLNGRQSETWAATVHGDLIGLASIWSEWGRPHRLTVRVLPDHADHDKLTRALLAKLLRRLRYLRRRYVTCEHRQDDVMVGTLLKAAGFKDKRHLLTMKLDM